jgi:hypothetical protein
MDDGDGHALLAAPLRYALRMDTGTDEWMAATLRVVRAHQDWEFLRGCAPGGGDCIGRRTATGAAYLIDLPRDQTQRQTVLYAACPAR